MNQQNSQQKSSSTGVIVFLLIVLIISAGVLGYLYYDQVKEKEKISNEKAHLIKEFNDLSIEFEQLKSENDTINDKLIQRQLEINQLVGEINRIKNTNAQIIRQYKKELNTLREIMKSYIVQIDSLNTKNQLLQAENIEVKEQMKQIKTELDKEREIKDNLFEKVEVGSKLTAKDMVAISLNEKGKEKDRISKIARIRMCFTIRENPIAEPGPRTVYMRIARPDDLILADSEDDLFEFEDKMIVYSAKRDIEYENQDLDVCIYWQNNGMLIPGNYEVNLFTDGYKIGSTFLTLR